MRLVDADKFRSELDNHYPFTKDEQSKHGMADIAKSTVLFVLNAMPTVDAVPVRCKDCKHHRYEKHFDKRIPYCDRINYGYGWQDDDFCSRGEPKDGDGNG